MMRQFIDRWKIRARELKVQVYALYLAYQDPRVPLHARIFAACVVGYALSPLDLIPDFIPILGWVDDLVLVPLGMALALRMIPTDVMAECRQKSREAMRQSNPANRLAAVLIIAVWLLLLILLVALLLRGLA